MSRPWYFMPAKQAGTTPESGLGFEQKRKNRALFCFHRAGIRKMQAEQNDGRRGGRLRFKLPCFIGMAVLVMLFLCACSTQKEDVMTLRVANWEEYIDLGDWDEDEAMELSDDTTIFGETPMIEEFEQWYEETHGKRIKVEYSTFGTNEDLYNQLTLGDVYDLVCPSEYMIMKMMHEGFLEEYDRQFWDTDIEENYYARGVSPYIKSVYDELSIDGESLGRYSAGYMWGTLGIVYNPELVSREDAAHWDILLNNDYYKRITIKDSIRDAYFAALAIENYDTITDEAFINSPDYHEKLKEVLNRTDESSVERAQDILTGAKENVYSFETDAGKADMVTGKVAANQQWSGDAVYVMEQAAEDDVMLCYSAPEEGTNLWFDGWVLLKSGIGGDAERKQAAQAFVNYISRPDNAVRNMYYIGYTSVISGGDSPVIRDYISYCYEPSEEEEEEEEEEGEAPSEGEAEGGAEPSEDETEDGAEPEDITTEAGDADVEKPEDAQADAGGGGEISGDAGDADGGDGDSVSREDADFSGDADAGDGDSIPGDDGDEAGDAETIDYDCSYFFGDDEEKGVFCVEAGSYEEAQLSTRYPQKSVVDRAVVMDYFDEEGNERINRMWTNVRCFDLKKLLSP